MIKGILIFRFQCPFFLSQTDEKFENRQSERIKGKKEIITELWYKYNYYPNNTWTYFVSENWFGKRTFKLIFINEIVNDAFFENGSKKISSPYQLIYLS